MPDEYDSGRMHQMTRQDEIIYTQGLMEGILWGYWVAVVALGAGKIQV